MKNTEGSRRIIGIHTQGPENVTLFYMYSVYYERAAVWTKRSKQISNIYLLATRIRPQERFCRTTQRMPVTIQSSAIQNKNKIFFIPKGDEQQYWQRCSCNPDLLTVI